MNTQISSETVSFHGHQLITAEHQSKTYVAMKPICEAIGLNWASQFKRIQRNTILKEGIVIMTTPSNKGDQETLFLPLKYLNGWLFGINPGRAREELRDTLLMYQRECYDVLHEYWQSKSQRLASPAFDLLAFQPTKTRDYRTATDALRELIVQSRHSNEVYDRLVYAEETIVDLFTVIKESLPGILRSADLMKKRYFH